jgi:hypothetical protein
MEENPSELSRAPDTSYNFRIRISHLGHWNPKKKRLR